MAFPPEAYLIGAQKAGTTTLAELLDQHPRIALSRPKEPNYYSANWERGPAWYRKRFPTQDGFIFLDATTAYSIAPVSCPPAPEPANPRADVPRRIHATRPDAKFIYVLRDPVTRTYSHYCNRVRIGAERRTFREAILASSIYLGTSYYAAQIRAYLAYFPLESFLVLSFDEFCEDPVVAARACYGFLGAEPNDFTPRFDGARNTSYALTDAGRIIVHAMPGRIRRSLVRAATRFLPRPIERGLRRILTRDVPAMSSEDRAFLIEVFREPNRELEELVGRRFERWLC